jgi:hypothetical protein
MAIEVEHGFRFSWQCFSDHDGEPAVDALAAESSVSSRAMPWIPAA